MLSRIKKSIKKFPKSPGVYFFSNKSGRVIYVGKAASLKDRVSSYFRKSDNPSQPPLILRGGADRPIEKMIEKVSNVKIKKTDTVIEAYFLEQELIKKHQPKYNVIGKDDKSASYVCVTNEDFPRFVIKRKTDLAKLNKNFSLLQGRKEKFKKIYGPYSSKHSIVTALKILRKIFPYHNRPGKTEKGCLAFQIGLCPGPYAGEIKKVDYLKNIRGVEMIFRGKKKRLIGSLKREMKDAAKKEEFEKAAAKRNQIFSLQHIQDVAFIKYSQVKEGGNHLRIEAYDISNISGKFATGSMVVFDNNSGVFKPNKSQYRKFKIKRVERVDDVAAMKEVLVRRFGNDWPKPDLLILDGGKGHLNTAIKIQRELALRIPMLAVAKGPTRKKIETFKYRVLSAKIKAIANDKLFLKQITDEAHRFAIEYHRKLRKRSSQAN